MKSKQVIILKKFPKGDNVPSGKYIAQGAHASVGALLKLGRLDPYSDNLVIPLYNTFVRDWILGSFTKVALCVDTEDELQDLYKAAIKLGIPASLIVDNGLTVFNGVPTTTAVGIGPGGVEEIDNLTSHLKLF